MSSAVTEVYDMHNTWDPHESPGLWKAFAAYSHAANYRDHPNPKWAWGLFHKLATDPDRDARAASAYCIGITFNYLPEKRIAWQDLHNLSEDKNNEVKARATEAIGIAFEYIPDLLIAEAWNDFYRLAQDQDETIRKGAANSIIYIATYKYIRNRSQSSNELIHQYLWAQESLFNKIDKELWEIFRKLGRDKSDGIRRIIARTYGDLFKYEPYKSRIIRELLRLAKDEDCYVRSFANHSFGRASVFMAAEAENRNELEKLLKDAIEYFEESFREETPYKPAKFCLPFYRSYFAVTFENANEDEIDKYLENSRKSIDGSKSREELFEAIQNLSKALKESQKLKGKSLEEISIELKAYRWYCEEASKFMISAEERAPIAIKLMKKCNPLLENKIQASISEIQKSAREICKNTRGSNTGAEAPGSEIYKAAKSLSTEDIYKTHRCASRITSKLKEFCELLPEDKRELVCSVIEEIKHATEFPDSLEKLELALAYTLSAIEVPLQVNDVTKEIQLAKEDILNHIDQNQGYTVEAILKELDDRECQNLTKEILDALVELLSEIRKKNALDSDQATKEKVMCAAKVIEDYHGNLKRKLEVTIPLIPVLLNYKWDVELEGGDINLRVAWNKLRSSLRV